MKKKTKAKARVMKFTARRREAVDLVKFIDAHGGRLGAVRGDAAAHRTPPSPDATRSAS